jgi:hypothetical protein
VLVVVIAVVVFAFGRGSGGGATDPGQAVAGYLDALATGDAEKALSYGINALVGTRSVVA